MKDLYNFCVKYQKWLGLDKQKTDKDNKLQECELEVSCKECKNKIGQWVEND